MSATLLKFQAGLPQKKICGFLAYQASTAFGRLRRRRADLLVGADHAEQDAVVLVLLGGDRLEADGRPARADLDVHARVAERPRVGVLVGVDRAVRTDQLIEEPVVGLGPPVGLDDDGVRADALELTGGRGGRGSGDRARRRHDRGSGGGRRRRRRRRGWPRATRPPASRRANGRRGDAGAGDAAAAVVGLGAAGAVVGVGVGAARCSRPAMTATREQRAASS